MSFSMFKASAVVKLRFFSKGDVWDVAISFFLAALGIYSIRQEFSYISLIYGNYPFNMELYLWRISIKHLRKAKMPMMVEICKWDKGKFIFIRQIYVSVKIR